MHELIEIARLGHEASDRLAKMAAHDRQRLYHEAINVRLQLTGSECVDSFFHNHGKSVNVSCAQHRAPRRWPTSDKLTSTHANFFGNERVERLLCRLARTQTWDTDDVEFV